MKNKFAIVIVALALLSVSLSLASAATSQPSVCCEKTNSGAFCLNVPESDCTNGSKKSPTSCESTSYCKLGTCYDSKEGLCMENTPQKTCAENGGTWDARKANEIPQCQLGCCVLADQAAYVPLVRCKRLATVYGLQPDYRTNINSEVACIATAQSQDMGACVFEKDFAKTCKFTTRKECGATEGTITANQTAENISTAGKAFYKGVLCSAEELGTECSQQMKTGCYQQKVYWFDSCGNKENVYSTDKAKSWNNGRVLEPDKVCAANNGQTKNCGNCDYLLGSRCGENTAGAPDFICKRTDCKDRFGNARLNGESWCVYDGKIGEGKDSVGSRHFKEVCVDGTVKVEACGDFRKQICIEGKVTNAKDFSVAACRVNRWQDCTTRATQEACENIDRRDCMWKESVIGLMIAGGAGGTITGTAQPFANPAAGQTFKNPTNTTLTGKTITGMASEDEEGTNDTTNRPDGVCVPNYPPGFEFWAAGDTAGICSQASAMCTVTYEAGIFGDPKPTVNAECLDDSWGQKVNGICTAIGDCGAYVNWIGAWTNDGYEWKIGNTTRKKLSGQAQSQTSQGVATGKAIGVNILQNLGGNA